MALGNEFDRHEDDQTLQRVVAELQRELKEYQDAYGSRPVTRANWLTCSDGSRIVVIPAQLKMVLTGTLTGGGKTFQVNLEANGDRSRKWMDAATTDQKIYNRIQHYCDIRMGPKGIGGHYGQEPYKGDYFTLFVDAHNAGLCGNGEGQVNGQRIFDHLYPTWLLPNDSDEAKGMVNELTELWDEWAYALEEYKRREG